MQHYLLKNTDYERIIQPVYVGGDARIEGVPFFIEWKSHVLNDIVLNELGESVWQHYMIRTMQQENWYNSNIFDDENSNTVTNWAQRKEVHGSSMVKRLLFLRTTV